ncbi:MAG TPA: hypothetical protein VGJ13_04855 [Pseudonocardiaceae bacterium]
MRALARLGSTEPEHVLSEREQARIRATVKARCQAPAEEDNQSGEVQRFQLARYNPEVAAELRRAALAKAARRARLVPWKASGATATVGATGLGVSLIAEIVAGPMGHLVASGGTALVSGATALGLSVLGRRKRRWRRSEDASAVGAVVLSTTIAAVGAATVPVLGPVWPWLGFVLLGGTAAEATVWRRSLQPRAAVQLPAIEAEAAPELEYEPELLTAVQEFADRWLRETAHKGGNAPGSQLYGGTEHEGGRMSFRLQMPGGMTLPKVQSRVVEIASELDLDPRQLVFDDPPPDERGWRSARQGLVQVVYESPITEVVEWTEPMWRNGRIGLGPYADGADQWAEYVLYAPEEGRARNGIVVGSTGSGKSGLVTSMDASARSSQLVVTIYLDPKLNSSPELAEAASVTVLGLDRAEEFTHAVQTLLWARGMESGLNGWQRFTAGPERLIYLIIIEECDMLFTLPGMAKRWGVIAKTCGALGVPLLLNTQIDGLGAFGNEEMLRSNTAAGNAVIMRTKSGSSGGQLIAPELPSARTLPQDPGLGYIAAQDARRALWRAAYLPDQQKRPDGMNAAVALARYPDAPMCPIGRRAFAAFLGESAGQRQQGERDRMQAALDAFLAGAEAAPVVGAVPDVQHTALDAVAAFGEFMGSAEKFAALPGPMAKVIQLHRPDASEVELSESDRKVLAAITDGCTRSWQIIDRVGLSGPWVSQICKRLAGLGLIVDGGHGVWTPPEDKAAGQ